MIRSNFQSSLLSLLPGETLEASGCISTTRFSSHGVLLDCLIWHLQSAVRCLMLKVKRGFLTLISLVDLSPTFLLVREDLFCVISSVLEVLLWLRRSSVNSHGLQATLCAHAHSDVADEKKKREGEDGEEDD